jgi:protease-4
VSARRGVALILTLILLAVLVSAAGLVLVALFTGTTPTIGSNSTLVLKINAPYSEIEPSDVLQLIQSNPAPTLRATVDAIHRAKTDARIKTLIVEPASAGALWGQAQEIHAALEDFKTSGKPVIAYLEAGGAGEYYLATAADRIVMMPAGQLDVAGLAFYELFFRGALDKLGVQPDMLHIGDYKTASNTFTERTFTAAHREMDKALNRDWYDELVRAVAKGRKLTEDAARRAVDGGPYLADGAQKAGLVDELAYRDQLDGAPPVKGTQQISQSQYDRALPSAARPQSGGRIALLYAVGTIASGDSSFDSPAGQVLGSDTFTEWIRKVRVDPGIRAVVVRIDSPGGSAIASEVIWRELMLTRDVKPVIVSMGDVAASGGYYIAAPAHVIVAQPGTLTGSIGVVTGKFVVQGGLDKIGVGSGAVSEGPFAEMNSPFRPFSTDERARVEEQMRTTYDLFVKRVADGRQQTPARIDAVAQGRVWTGHQARELGLVDELGGLDLAIRRAAERAKLDPAKGVSLVVYPAKRSIYDLLSRQFGSSTDASAGLEAIFHRPEIRAVQTAVSALQLFRRGEPLAILPSVFTR